MHERTGFSVARVLRNEVRLDYFSLLKSQDNVEGIHAQSPHGMAAFGLNRMSSQELYHRR